MQEALQIIAETLRMASAAVFVVKAGDAAEVLAACGDTRQRFPSRRSISATRCCGDAGVPGSSRSRRGRLQPSLLAVLCPGGRRS